MKKWIPVLLFFVLFWPGNRGWSEERFQTGLIFTMGFPQADFEDNVDQLMVGGEGYFLYRLPESFIYVGLSAGIQVYGSERWADTYSPTFPEILLDARTRNQILLGHLMVRLQPRGDIRPYLEGLFGLSYIWTETSLYDSGWGGNDDLASAVNFSDTTFSYGGGIWNPVHHVRDYPCLR